MVRGTKLTKLRYEGIHLLGFSIVFLCFLKILIIIYIKRT
jgi:hypothetical protein